MHLIPPGQQPFLRAGQEPTVLVFRDLVIGQTWKPAAIQGGDTFWLSNSAGAPATERSACVPRSGTDWIPFGTDDGATAKPTAGLMKPSLVHYAGDCGVTIHLNESPASNEADRVTKVSIQVLDVKTLNAFAAKHQQQ